ncbi:MAG TPA: tyrosine-type recombinase/integrase, partial [Rubrobacteraceae bacterium]|nr:tyrosine-type recombinase/integrase [Rubrobacteraceae bacterium]
YVSRSPGLRYSVVKPLLTHAGLPDIRFHDLPHTCATLLLSRGHHPKLMHELLGHATVALTLNR